MVETENSLNHNFEVSSKEIYNDTGYIITVRGYTETFELIVEDENKCFIWQKSFGKDYVGKLCERVKGDIDLNSVMNYLKEVFEKNEVKLRVDLMHGDTAKSQLEKNKSGDIKKGTLIESQTSPLKDQVKTDEVCINNNDQSNTVNNSMNVDIPPAGERIIFILQYQVNNEKLVLPFPQKYNKAPSPMLFRSIIISLRGQLRKLEKSDTTGGFRMGRPSSTESSSNTTEKNKDNFINEIGGRKPANKVQSEKVDSEKGDENPNKVGSMFQTDNNEVSTQNSQSQNMIVLTELKNENISLKSQIHQLKDVNVKLKKQSGAVELDNIIVEKASLENKVDILKRKCDELEMHVRNANELRSEIDRKDRELSIVKDQLRNMPQGKVEATNNNNYYNNRTNARNSNMFMKKDQVPSRPGLPGPNNKYNIFPKMGQNQVPSTNMYNQSNNYHANRNRYSAAGNNRPAANTRQNLNSRSNVANNPRLPNNYTNSTSRNRLGANTNVSASIRSNRNSSNNLLKNVSEKRFIQNNIKASHLSNTDTKKSGMSNKNLNYNIPRNKLINERSMSNPKILMEANARQDSSMMNKNPSYRNSSNGPRINIGKSGNISLSHSRSIENNRNRGYPQPKFNSKKPLGYA